MTEWLIWTTIPRMLALAAITAAIGGVRPPNATLLALLLVTGAREARAAYDQRRVTLALHTAQQHASGAATHTQEFLARIIHDIAAPLHGLWNATDRLNQEQTVVTSLHVQLQHLTDLVEQLRAYQQARHFHVALPDLEVIDMVSICAAAIEAIQHQADARGIALRLACSTEASYIVADAAALRRVLDNLLSNAITATAQGGEVTICISPIDTRTVLLEVADTGCGIPLEEHDHIFAPLVRLHGEGTGLGLAIVRELVHAMRGEIGLRSQIGHGSTFWIRLSKGDR